MSRTTARHPFLPMEHTSVLLQPVDPCNHQEGGLLRLSKDGRAALERALATPQPSIAARSCP